MVSSRNVFFSDGRDRRNGGDLVLAVSAIEKTELKRMTDVSKVNSNVMFCGMHFFLLQSLNVFLYR